MIKEGYPVINGGIQASGYTNNFNEYEETITISQGGASAGFVNFMLEKFWAGAHCYIIKPNTDKLINKYLFFVLKNIEIHIMELKNGAGIPGINKNKITKIKIPLLPIEVQKEIVRILDTFTKYQDLLNRELELRKKQYEYYRDKLLTFSNDKAQWKRLGDIAHIVMGQSPDSKSYNNKNIGLPFLQGCASFGTIYPLINTYSSDIKKIAVNGSILMSVRAPVGKLNIANTDICIGRGLCSINSNCEVSNKYVFYSLKNIIKYIADKSKGAIFDSITSDSIRNIKIPVPPLEEQERIVNILDKFDALCNDITRGLPAEIKLRKKQYEYYRDKLLTFKEKKK
ncbi:putative restriction endonuclease type I S subunit [Brachyspira pilosicoli P43/6/78]|uniref:Putative restriction endonuclease type I S subunit n=2 Tax=Brachyspira pilosicoli TaxID=52584 RepID=A0A3B6VSY1_BRAPL|nr:putative restriction endonuclease type I S subunit [Brachyspira pilosicoli P43/6/78]